MLLSVLAFIIFWSMCSGIGLILLGRLDKDSSESDDELKLGVLFAGPLSFIVVVLALIVAIPAIGLIESGRASGLLKLAKCYYNIGFKNKENV
jgi:Na+-driven multidrug efflux pump